MKRQLTGDISGFIVGDFITFTPALPLWKRILIWLHLMKPVKEKWLIVSITANSIEIDLP